MRERAGACPGTWMVEISQPPQTTLAAAERIAVCVLLARRPARWQSALRAALERDGRFDVRSAPQPGGSRFVLDARTPFANDGASVGAADGARPGAETYAVRFGRPRATGAPPFFEDVLAGDHAVRAALVRTTALGEQLVRDGYFLARLTDARTMRDAAPEIAAWFARAVATDDGFVASGCGRRGAALAAGAGTASAADDGSACTTDDASASAAGPRLPSPLHAPTPRNRARVLARTVGFRVRRIARGLARRRSRWGVGVIDAPVATLLTHTPPVRWLAPHDAFLADPIPVPDSDAVLCERLEPDGAGAIVALDPNDGVGAPRSVLALATHLSYPYVVRDGAATYLIPESAASGRLDAFAFDPVALRATFARTLLALDACDPTFVRHAGRWWLFCTRASSLPDANLYAYHADAIAGPWLPHARNPVKTDVRGARPGGMPFVAAGRLYRPAQDCSLSYGGALVLQRVDRLSPDDFAETPVRRIEPDRNGPYPHGLHTLSWRGDRCFVDGRIDARR